VPPPPPVIVCCLLSPLLQHGRGRSRHSRHSGPQRPGGAQAQPASVASGVPGRPLQGAGADMACTHIATQAAPLSQFVFMRDCGVLCVMMMTQCQRHAHNASSASRRNNCDGHCQLTVIAAATVNRFSLNLAVPLPSTPLLMPPAPSFNCHHCRFGPGTARSATAAPECTCGVCRMRSCMRTDC
jgi:hypothetical protein